jgi:hypothetical protein
MSDSKIRIALVGHCTPDAFAILAAINSMTPGVAIARINDQEGTVEAAKSTDLLLVNRALDGDFAAEDGIELIRALAGSHARTMLISNFHEAQTAAEAAGALPGFGKSAMYAESTKQRLRSALGIAVPTK